MAFTPDPSWIDVTDFGAVGDGTTDDAAAIQAAIDTAGDGDTVYVPPGDYRLGASLALGVANTTLRGVGPASILRLMDDTFEEAISVPVPYPTGFDPTFNVAGITISDLTVSGNFNGEPPGSGSDNYFGIFIRQASAPRMRRLVVRDWLADGITWSQGLMAVTDPVVEDCLFINCRRNGIHAGFSVGGATRRCRFSDTPSSTYPVLGASAGSGIDIEVEGYALYEPPGFFPYVTGHVIEDCLFERAWCNTAGAAISVQPAYGYANENIIRRNVMNNHQRAVETTGALDVYGQIAGIFDLLIEANWMSAGPATAPPDEYGFQVIGNALNFLCAADVTVTGNIVNDRTEPGWFSRFAVDVQQCIRIDVTGNTLYLYDHPSGTGNAGIAQVHSSQDITVTDNDYRTSGDVTIWDAELNTPAVVDSGNVALPHDPHELSLPTCSFSVTEGQVISAPTTVTVTASDADSAIARVFFFVDGIPSGLSDAAPHQFAFDPDDHTAGDHVLSAMAVDEVANLGTEASVTVEVPGGAEPPVDGGIINVGIPGGVLLYYRPGGGG